MKDGPYYSPDGGKFWQKGNQKFWEDGEVTTDEPGMAYRAIPWPGGEDYSLWSDDYRNAAKTVAASCCCAFRQIEREAKKKRIAALQASIRAKLTPEELAICDLEDLGDE